MVKEKQFYWIKVNKDFLTSEKVDFLMSQKDGANYVVLYQCLCLKTINTGGELANKIGEIIIPFDEEKIQRDCKWFTIDTIRVALELYRKLGLVYVQENGILRITDFENIVGSETYWARIKRKNKQQLLESGQRGDKCPPYIDIDIKKDIETNKDIDIKKDTIPPNPQREREQLTAIYNSYSFDDDVKEAIKLWLKYKKEKKQGYKPTGLTTLLNRLKKDCEEKGNSYVIRNIEFSIENNYSGIYESKERTQNTIKQPIGICEDRERLLRLIKEEQQ